MDQCDFHYPLRRCPNEAVDYREIISVLNGESHIILVCETHINPPARSK